MLKFSQIIRVKSTLFCRKPKIISKIMVFGSKSKVAKQSLFRSFFITKYNGRFCKKNQSVVDFVKKFNLKRIISHKKTAKSIEICKTVRNNGECF